MRTIGDRIRAKREELGMTQQELAEKLGYTSKVTVCKVETRDYNLTADRIQKFANALNVSASYLMGWDLEQKQAEEDADLLSSFHSLSEQNKKVVKTMILSLKKSQEE